MKIIEAINKCSELEKQIGEVPFYVTRFFTGNIKPCLHGTDVSLCSEGDYGRIEEYRKALDWLCDQFGGKVRWEKKSKK